MPGRKRNIIHVFARQHVYYIRNKSFEIWIPEKPLLIHKSHIRFWPVMRGAQKHIFTLAEVAHAHRGQQPVRVKSRQTDGIEPQTKITCIPAFMVTQ